MVWTNSTFPSVLGKVPIWAPLFIAITAFLLNEPKLMAEIFKIQAEYGFLQSEAPTNTLGLSIALVCFMA